jgi:hypothetical protein
MDPEHAQDKAFTTRRDQKTSQYVVNSNQSQRARYAGTELRHQPLRDDRANWQRRDTFNQSGGITTGGILLQLIEETHEQLADCELQVEKLHERLSRLQKLREQLEHKTGE